MGAIDIGPGATDRGTTNADMTQIVKDNPANDTGAITSVEIYGASDLPNCEVATFEEVTTDTFTTRDSETLGTITGGSKQTVSGLDMDVETGDYLGIYFGLVGDIEADDSGYVGLWIQSGDNIPCTSTSFTYYAGYTVSIYGTGATPGWSGKVSGVTNPAKVMGVDVASINKVKGVASA